METTDTNFTLPVYEVPTDLQRYLLVKWQKENPPPEIYHFRSDRQGVFAIRILKVLDSSKSGTRIYGDGRKKETRKYLVEGSPYEVAFEEGKSSVSESYSGSGMGDLWSYSHFFSFDKNEIVRMQDEEKERIIAKYFRVSEEEYLKAKETVQKYEEQNG